MHAIGQCLVFLALLLVKSLLVMLAVVKYGSLLLACLAAVSYAAVPGWPVVSAAEWLLVSLFAALLLGMMEGLEHALEGLFPSPVDAILRLQAHPC